MSEKGSVDTIQHHGWIGRDRQSADRMPAGRPAEQATDFLLPHLRAGMRMLDCGCGPSLITLVKHRLAPPPYSHLLT